MKISRCLAALPILLGLTGSFLAAPTVAYPLSSDDAFCARVQQFIAGTDLAVDNVLYERGSYWTSFKESKPTAKPLTSHQYVGYQFSDGQRVEFPVTVACKMKTAERIRTAHGSAGELTVADQDRQCQQWLDVMLTDIYRALEEQGDTDLLPRERVSLDDENNVYIGPFWLRPELYQVAYREGDTLNLRSKALHVEYRRLMPVPNSFMGTHYCTMIAPEYLAQLLRGEVEAPPLMD
ncbi:hypothetical protein AUP74_02955 [Microbulbifer aggregans]|uniref:Uncharacterized protein n=1 Tax=Microbulbifer aggregans TaxID=1769779 RepID=A0A1C9WB03_9GAMM|nr:hypothetical protein [Microbulbifer aggregans]AOS98326.1 hypothetical protein AUP74_02955 [Microbulbifer aggregans]